jgi:hypothetical protein
MGACTKGESLGIVQIVVFVGLAGAMGWTYHQVVRRRPDLRRQARVAVGVGFVALMAYQTVVIVEQEFSRDDIDVGPVIEGGRVERPEQGFAVTFPDDWTVQAISPEYSEELSAGAGVEGLMTTLVVGSDEDAGAGCVVGETTLLMREMGWTSVDAFIDGTTAEAIDLPAGVAAREPGVGQSGRSGTQYRFEEDGEWFILGCYADDPPDDRWLSVAETFEFLPAEE